MVVGFDSFGGRAGGRWQLLMALDRDGGDPHRNRTGSAQWRTSEDYSRLVRLDAARHDALIQMLAHGLIRLLARQRTVVEMSDE